MKKLKIQIEITPSDEQITVLNNDNGRYSPLYPPLKIKEPLTSGPEDMEEDEERKTGVWLFVGLMICIAFFALLGYTGYKLGYAKGANETEIARGWKKMYYKQKENSAAGDSLIVRQRILIRVLSNELSKRMYND